MPTPSLDKLKLSSSQDIFLFFLSPALFFILFLAFCATVINFSGYSWLIPFHFMWSFPIPAWEMALALWFLMFLSAKLTFKKSSPITDLPLFWTRLGLFITLALAAFLCSYHMNVPPGNFDNDVNVDLYWPRNMKDLGGYGNFASYPALTPTWAYVALFFWRLLPQAPGVIIQRLANEAFAFATILVMYQVGKELAGRRMGLYCAVLTTLSKALLFKVVSCILYTTLPFFMGLVFWGTLRLSRKNASHPFLWWGVTVGLLAYSCNPCQPFVFFFIFAGLFFVWWNNRSTMRLQNSSLIVWVSAIIFVIYALYVLDDLPLGQWFGINMDKYYFQAACLFLIVALGLIVACLRGWLPIVKKSLWTQWVFGAWLAALIAYPCLAHPIILQRIREHGLVQGSHYLNWAYISMTLMHIPETLGALFLEYMDRPDMGLGHDPFFSYTETILIGLGLVFCAVKPNFKWGFIVVSAAVGLVPHFFVGMVHGGLLMGCLIPFLLITAIGLNELTEIVLNATRTRKVWIFSFVLILFGAWSAQSLFSRVYTQWAEVPEDVMIYRDRVLADMAKGYRVYFADQIFNPVTNVMYDGHHFHQLVSVNSIYLTPGEKVPEVVMYIPWEEKSLFKKYMLSAFPHTQWEKLTTPLESNVTAKAYRCEIPAETISKSKNNFFIVHWIQGDFWKRTWGFANFGLNFSGISWEDKVPDVNKAPLPTECWACYQNVNLKLESTIHIAQNGKYEVTCGTGNRTILYLDGEKLFDLSFPIIGNDHALPVTRKTQVNLKKGNHQVEVITFFQFENQLPSISFKPVDLQGNDVSLWNSFNF